MLYLNSLSSMLCSPWLLCRNEALRNRELINIDAFALCEALDHVIWFALITFVSDELAFLASTKSNSRYGSVLNLCVQRPMKIPVEIPTRNLPRIRIIGHFHLLKVATNMLRVHFSHSRITGKIVYGPENMNKWNISCYWTVFQSESRPWRLRIISVALHLAAISNYFQLWRSLFSCQW